MNLYKKLGAGLLYAGAAIGVSHLVQSTRAGSLYGFDLALVVLIVHLLKYPFFEASSRYVSSQKKNLLEAYNDLHPAFLFIFLLQTFLTMFIVQAAVTTVTAGLIVNILGIDIHMTLLSSLLFLCLFFVLVKKKVSLLNKVMKPMMLLLVLCTLTAFLMALGQIENTEKLFTLNFDFEKKSDLYFLAAFIGWMPSPLDACVWHSVWACDEIKEGHSPKKSKDVLFDLRFSYFLILLLAFLFLSLGAFLMHTEGQSFSPGAVSFASELINLYQKSLGSSAYIIVAVACLMTMISTTLTCWDAFARIMSEGTSLLSHNKNGVAYGFFLCLVACGSLLLIHSFSYNMKALIDFATVVAFLMTPIIAFLGFALIIKTKDPRGEIFPPLLKLSTGFCTLILTGSSLWYLLFLM